MAIEPLTEEQAAEGLRRLGEEKAEEQALDLARGKKLVERYEEVMRQLLAHEQRRLMLSTQIGTHNDLAHAGEVGTMSPDDIRKAADELEAILKATAELGEERRHLEAQLPDADSPGYGALLAQAPDLSKATGAWLNQPGGDATIEDRLEAYGFDPGGEERGFRPTTQPARDRGAQEEDLVKIRCSIPSRPIPGRTQEQIDANEAAAREVAAGQAPQLGEPPPGYAVPKVDPPEVENAGLSCQVQALEDECRRLRYESEARRQALNETIDEVRTLRKALEEWQKASDLEKCEGCDRPADTEDEEGVPLCLGCAGLDPEDAKPKEFTGQVGQG